MRNRRPALTLEKSALFLAAALFAGVLGWYFAEAYIASLHFDGYPIDGVFQTYAPLRKMHQGLVSGRDFDVFHGIGIPYLQYPFFLWKGANISGAIFAAEWLSGCAFALLNALFLAALGLPLPLALAGTGLMSLIAAGYIPNPRYFFSLKALAFMGNSSLGIRSAPPVLAAAVFYLASKSGRFRRGPRLQALAGGLVGLGLVFSMEHGLAASLAFLLLFAFLPAGEGGSARKAASLGAFAASFLAASFLSFWICTAGSPWRAIRYAFVDIPQDQFWYFGSPPNPFVFDPGFFLHMPVMIYIGAAMIPLFAAHFLRDRDWRSFVCAFLLLSSLIAGTAAILGIRFGGYYWPFQRAIYLTSPFALICLWDFAPGGWKSALKRALSERGAPPWPWSAVAGLLAAACGFFILFPASIWDVKADYDLKARPYARDYVPEWGLSLGRTYAKTFEMARIVRSSIPPGFDRSKDVLLFSTYATALEMMLGESQPTGWDYIIHALGERNREKYFREFIAMSPLFVTTLREDFTPYETWLQSAHWDFYRHLLLNYTPIFKSSYSVLWRRNPKPFDSLGFRQFPCRPLRLGGVDFSYEVMVDPALKSSLVEVNLSYQMKYSPFQIPFLHRLPRIIIGSRDSAAQQNFALPPHRRQASFPLRYVRGRPPIFVALTIPKFGARVEPLGCRATYLPLGFAQLGTVRKL